jgi:hypothetical protein
MNQDQCMLIAQCILKDVHLKGIIQLKQKDIGYLVTIPLFVLDAEGLDLIMYQVDTSIDKLEFGYNINSRTI